MDITDAVPTLKCDNNTDDVLPMLEDDSVGVVEDEKALASLWEVWKPWPKDSCTWAMFKPVLMNPSPPYRVTRLGLSDCRLKGPVPSQIGLLTPLRRLDLDQNQLTSLPPEIGKLSSLEYLRLDANQLTSLPPEMGRLLSLRVLVLSANRLTSIPLEMGQLVSLRTLHLDDNQLTSLPPEMGHLSSLQFLNLSHNQLTRLPPEMGHLSSLSRLDLAENQLTSLPPKLESLSSLTYLDLSANQLTSLPPAIGRLSSLEAILLRRNQLTSLPLEMTHLTSLRWLDLDHNQLVSIPSFFTTAKEFPLTGNFFIAIPSTGQCDRLVSIGTIGTQRLPATLDACSFDDTATTTTTTTDGSPPPSLPSVEDEFTLRFYTDGDSGDKGETEGRRRKTRPSCSYVRVANRNRLAERWPYFRRLLDADLFEAQSGYADLSAYFSVRLGQCLVDYFEGKPVHVSSLSTQDCHDLVAHADYFSLGDILLLSFCTAKLKKED
ncbi:MAG: leucine-rich repeat domain-containing protein [Candidatus Paceibacterota bacterium]|jgi:Leucine-rich repeat (LRR) protein